MHRLLYAFVVRMQQYRQGPLNIGYCLISEKTLGAEHLGFTVDHSGVHCFQLKHSALVKSRAKFGGLIW